MLINLNSIETVMLVRDSVEQACNEEMEMELLVNKGQVHTDSQLPSITLMTHYLGMMDPREQ